MDTTISALREVQKTRVEDKWKRLHFVGGNRDFVMKEVAIMIELEGWKISWHIKEMVGKIIVLREAEAGKQWNVQVRWEKIQL